MNVPAPYLIFDQNYLQQDKLALANTKLNEAKQLMEMKRYDVAADLAGIALQLATETKTIDKNFPAVKFYYACADMILTKLLLIESELSYEVNQIKLKKDNILGIKVITPSTTPKSNSEASPATLDIIKAAATKGAPLVARDYEEEEQSQNEVHPPTNDIKVEEKKEDKPVAVIQDELQVAWEYLETARLISEIELSAVPNNSKEKAQVSEALGCIFMRMGDLLVMRGQITEGISEYKKALEIRQSDPQQYNRNIAETYCSLGMAYMSIAKRDQALESFDNAKRIIEPFLAKQLKVKEIDTKKLLDAFVDSGNIVAKKLQDVLKMIWRKVSSLYHILDHTIGWNGYLG